jgi:hypothetical protein
LLVIADDRFMALAEWGKLAAEHASFIRSAALDGEVGYFITNQFESLGGVALFKTDVFLSGGLQPGALDSQFCIRRSRDKVTFLPRKPCLFVSVRVVPR